MNVFQVLACLFGVFVLFMFVFYLMLSISPRSLKCQVVALDELFYQS